MHFCKLPVQLLQLTQMPNQNPEQLARDQVDKQLIAGG
jgi:hypothetical protein